MKISEKIEAFQNKTLSSEEVLADALPRLRVTKADLIQFAFFEPGASAQSGLIGLKGEFFIGRRSYMNNGGYLRDGVFIGRYCSIGRRVTIGAGSHRMEGLTTSPTLRSTEPMKAYSAAERDRLCFPECRDERFTVLMNDVWVGDGAVITRGVTVGTGAVVGANAVVTRDVAPYAVVAGSPAQMIRYRFPKDVIKGLLASSWWEYSHDLLSSLPINNVLSFLEALGSREDTETEVVATYSLADQPIGLSTAETKPTTRRHKSMQVGAPSGM